MKKAFTINCMRKQDDFDGYIKLLKENVYQGVEIFYPYNVSKEQAIFYTGSIKKIKKENPNLEIVMHLPHGEQNSLTNERVDSSYKLMINAIEYAKEFNVKKLTLHLGSVSNDIPRFNYIEKIVPILQRLCDYAKKYQMNVMIENMPDECELGVSPNELLEIIEKTNRDNIKFILDTGHAFVSKYSLTSFVYTLKDYLIHMHFNDNNGEFDEHKRMHSGKIDFNNLFKALAKINYNELHCTEVIFKNYQELILFSEDLEQYQKEYIKVK